MAVQLLGPPNARFVQSQSPLASSELVTLGLSRFQTEHEVLLRLLRSEIVLLVSWEEDGRSSRPSGVTAAWAKQA
jgi:hypothetical protein